MKGPASFGEVYDNVKAMVDQVAINVGQTTKPTPVVAVISVKVDPAQMDGFKEAIGYNARNSRMEPGCMRFDVVQN